jgi:hypothetical protein
MRHLRLVSTHTKIKWEFVLQTFGFGHDIREAPFIRPVRLPRCGRRRHLDFGLSEHLLQISFARE